MPLTTTSYIPVDHITDSGATGRAVVQSETPAAARTATKAPATSLTVASLFSFSVANDDQVVLAGYHTAGDGGGQVVRYDFSSVATIDGGFTFPGVGGTLSFDGAGVFNGTAGTGRFVAIDITSANPRCFGAKGDDSTDDTRSLQAAITASKSVKIPVGRYKHTGLTISVADTKVVGDGRGSVLILTAATSSNLTCAASFLVLRDFKLLTDSDVFETLLADTVGLDVTNCTRSTFDALMIGEKFFAHSIAIKMFGAAANWLNNITNCQINYNLIGIHGCGHSTTISGGEIQAGKHGIIHGLIDSSYDPDLTDTTTGTIGHGISILSVAIEGQDHETPAGIAYGIYWKNSQMGPTIKGCYFELIGRYDDASPADPVTNGVAIQIGQPLSQGYQVFGGSIDGCFFARTPKGISIGRCDGLNISGNYAPPPSQDTGHFLIDASDALVTSYLSIHDNYSNSAKYINDPSSKLSNSRLGTNLIGDRGGSGRAQRKIEFAVGITIPDGAASTDAVNKGQMDVAGAFATINDTTTARILATTDARKYLRMNNAAATDVTVNSLGFVVDDEVVITQIGAGQVTIVSGPGVTINKSEFGTYKTAGQGTPVTLKYVAVDEWDLGGETEAA